MPTRVFSDAELEALRGFPEITAAELIRYFWLAQPDLEFARRRHGPRNQLGVAVQVAVLGWLGFVPDDLAAAPAAGVGSLAEQLGVPFEVFADYGRRDQTRTDHLREVAAFLGWRTPGAVDLKELDLFLLARAMEHDSPSVLFRLACEYLRSAQLIRPGPVVLVERVASARAAAKTATYERVERLLTRERCAELDELLVVDPEVGHTRLFWLGDGATQASPAAVKSEVAKLAFLRGLGADRMDLSAVPAERRRFLAGIGRRSTAQALVRREDERRYPILLAFLAETAVEVLDEVVGLFDQTLSGRESHARHRLDDQLAERARASEGRIGLLDEMLAIAADPSIPDLDVGGRLRAGIGMGRLHAAHAAKQPRLPRDYGHLELIESSFAYVREFAPLVLSAVGFAGGTDADELVAASGVLRELYATGGRQVPAGTPAGFVPTRWQDYLAQAEADGDKTAYRHYWELCVLLGLRDGLRSGDVWVPGSRRYADPASYLISKPDWNSVRAEFCQLVSKPADAAAALAGLTDELHAAVGDLDEMLAGGDGPVRLDDSCHLVIGRLTAESVPDEVDVLRDRVAALLPRVPLASMLIEMDCRCGFTGALTHAAGKTTRSPDLARNLFACLIAQACNIGLVAMAEASGISYDKLAWTAEWYLRDDSLRAAIAAVVNFQHHLPMAQIWGAGTMSSSDGQRFPTKGKSISARALSRYFADEGISTYTHVSDQHATYGTQVIVATQSEATYVLDEILGNATDLPISEHVTDTGGVTLVNFACFDLVDKQFSRRIRDLGKITLNRIGSRRDTNSRWPHAGPLLTTKANTALIIDHWDDLLRLAASLKYGRTTASLVVGKLCASTRQNAFAAALKEYGAVRRTIHAARYLTDEDFRRRIGRQLNKGEGLHSLRRGLFFAREGHVRHRDSDQQTEQALCLSLVTNLIVAWNIEYLARAVAALRSAGETVDDSVLAHLWPTMTGHVRFHGTYAFELDRELAALDAAGYRPLRPQQGDNHDVFR